jgi:hypothetical protein
MIDLRGATKIISKATPAGITTSFWPYGLFFNGAARKSAKLRHYLSMSATNLTQQFGMDSADLAQ